MFRKFATALAVTFGLLVLSAGPADARPVVEPELYYGPTGTAPEKVCFWLVFAPGYPICTYVR